jgi:hypothetical protein
MALPAEVLHLAQSWSDYYDDHTIVSVTVLFGHIAGLLLAGGAALAADRFILDAARGDDALRAVCLARLPGVHRMVAFGLALVVVSGVLMTFSDLNAFLASGVFYLKGAFFLLLILNGFVLLGGERGARVGDGVRGWQRLRASAIASSFLWLATAFIGVLLTKAA